MTWPMRKIDDVEKEQWLDLYRFSKKVVRMNPWASWGPSDVFAVWPRGEKEPYFVTTMHVDDSKALFLRFIRGWKSFFKYCYGLSNKADFDASWMLELPMFEMAVLKSNLLFPIEHAFYRAIGLHVPAKNRRGLVFRKLEQGYQPWLPQTHEVPLLKKLVYQTLGIALRLESQPQLLSESLQKREVLTLREQKDGTWKEGLLPSPDKVEESIMLDVQENLLRELKKRPLSPEGIQLDLVYLSQITNAHGEPGKNLEDLDISRFPERQVAYYMLVAVGKTNQTIYNSPLLTAEKGVAKMWGDLHKPLFQLFQQIGGFPSSIEATGFRMPRLLRGFETTFPFKLVFRDRLDLLEDALPALFKYLDVQNREKKGDQP